ncbi:MAG: hypothetical protein AAGM22_04760 [Acidobacteriota bacterium]
MLRHATPWLTAAALVLGSAPASVADTLDAKTAFDRLAAMAGTWTGSPDASDLEIPDGEAPPPPEVRHEIQVSANGSVVMETMNPGTDHEMINMYHLDGDELVMTHYCAGGNQPTMKLALDKSTADRLVFDFTGGTNLDPKVDGFIHDAELVFTGDNQVESRWGGYNAGQPTGTMVFHLARSK